MEISKDGKQVLLIMHNIFLAFFLALLYGGCVTTSGTTHTKSKQKSPRDLDATAHFSNNVSSSSATPSVRQVNRGIFATSDPTNTPTTTSYVEERRVALVIGNSDYKHSPLINPKNDASDMANILRNIGFEVIHFNNLDRKGFRDAIRTFGDKILNGGVGLFFYAGHGVQIKGKNYLIPVGVDIQREEEVIDEAVEANLILRKMDVANNRLNIVILDACRNNPFARSFRSGESGLARMDAPRGSLIAFSTSPNSVADDGTGRNSPFTKHLLKAIQIPGITVERVFKQVRLGVLEETDKEQTPWELSSLTGEFRFVPNASWLHKKSIDEVKKHEIELENLKTLKTQMEVSGEKNRVLELERRQVAKKAAIRLAKLREDAIRKQAFLENKKKLKIEKDKHKQILLEQERLKKIERLKYKAMSIREKIGDSPGTIHISGGAKEIRRINKTLKNIKEDFISLLDSQIRSIDEHYSHKIDKARNVKPWDKMFETELEYNARVLESKQTLSLLEDEKFQKITEIRKHIDEEMGLQRNPLIMQKNNLMKNIYRVNQSNVSFDLLSYNPNTKTFKFTSVIHDETFIGEIPVQKSEAVIIWKNKELLIPDFTVGLDKYGNNKIIQKSFKTPDGNVYTARNFASVFIEPTTGMILLRIQGGCSTIGDRNTLDNPEKNVCVKDIFIGESEVTQEQWKIIMGSNPSKFSWGVDHPVEQVSWHDVQNFLLKLNKSNTLMFRLPTEYEWEYACRSGIDLDKLSSGDNTEQRAWYSENSKKHTHKINKKNANKFGLFDMRGNVWEWVQSQYGEKGVYQEIRGGSWASGVSEAQCSSLKRKRKKLRYYEIGFRVVAESMSE